MLPTQHAPAAGPYARFFADMPDWINMTQQEPEDIKSWEDLPLPAVGHVPPGISLEQAIQVSKDMYIYA